MDHFEKDTLPGILTRDYQLQDFFMNQFPRAPEYTIKEFSNFYKNDNDTCDKHKVLNISSIFRKKNLNGTEGPGGN
jgi:hypothetical protein